MRWTGASWLGLAWMAAALASGAARAEASLPILALDPPPPPSIWKGFYVGTEVFAGASGHKGFFGGDTFAGYDRVLANNLVVGIRGSVGYAPVAIGPSFARGVEFAILDSRVAYPMGRWTPYLTSGVVLTKADYRFAAVPTLSSGDALSALLGSSGTLEAAPRVGAGVSYALTPNLSVGVGFHVGSGAAAFLP